MEIDEAKLPISARHVLAIIRADMKVGRLTEEEATFVRDAVRMKVSFGIVGKFIMQLAAVIVALGTIFTLVKVWWLK